MSAQSTAALSTNDLRSNSVDYKRDAEQKHKWQFGDYRGPGRSETAHAAPIRLNHLNGPRAIHRDEVLFNQRKQSKHARSGVRVDDDELTESSAEEEVDAPCAAPVLDADVTYSFDNPRGATHGSQVLSSALDKAVERFESSATDRLVKDEYEVLDANGEPIANSIKGKKSKSGAPALKSPTDEAEYEFV